jgi:hypothetical protein
VKEKDKNKKSSLSEFQRYIRGEMTKREENSFLRKFKNDPFAEEAVVNFSGISPQEAVDDKDTPGKHLKKWIKSRKRMVLFSAAALVSVLVIISSVFIILDKNRTAKQLNKDVVKPVPPEVTDSNQITGFLLAESKNISDTMGIEVKQEITNDKIDTAISAGIDNSAITENTKALAMTEGKDSGLYIDEDQISTPAVEFGMQGITGLNVRGKIVSSENNLPVAGVKVLVKGTNTGTLTDTGGNFKIMLPDEKTSTLVADFAGMETKEFQAITETEMLIKLNHLAAASKKIVFTEFGMSKKTDNKQPGYIYPQPFNGISNFNRYIEDNMIKPLANTQGEDSVVVISFMVLTTGTIDSIMVITGPGDEFAREAIRLIKEGPAWKPAENNGQTIDDEVRVRIVFK